MIRWIIRKLLLCGIILALIYYLNVKNPGWMGDLGRWVGGKLGDRVSVAVGEMMGQVGENPKLSEVVEAFREGY